MEPRHCCVGRGGNARSESCRKRGRGIDRALPRGERFRRHVDLASVRAMVGWRERAPALAQGESCNSVQERQQRRAEATDILTALAALRSVKHCAVSGSCARAVRIAPCSCTTRAAAAHAFLQPFFTHTRRISAPWSWPGAGFRPLSNIRATGRPTIATPTNSPLRSRPTLNLWPATGLLCL